MVCITLCGKRSTIPEKMSSEMPLPMPRSVICSPSHMMNAVPAVKLTTVMKRKVQLGSLTTDSAPTCRLPKIGGDRKTLRHRQHDGAIARVLRDFVAAGFAFFDKRSKAWE